MSKAFNRETGEYDWNHEPWCEGCIWEAKDGACTFMNSIEHCKKVMKFLVEEKKKNEEP